jgi:hypothetical protein
MRQGIGFAAIAALAACGGGGDKAEGGNAAAGAAGNESGGGSAAAVAMQPGEWEITTTVARVSVPGMPAGAATPLPGPTTVRSCLTPEQASQPGAGIFTGAGEGEGCTYESNNISGGRVQAVVQCSQGGQAMRSTVTGQFAATSFEVSQQVQASGVEMESRTVGRRVGDCEGGAP